MSEIDMGSSDYIEKIKEKYNCPPVAKIENYQIIPPEQNSLFVIAECSNENMNNEDPKFKHAVWSESENKPILPVRVKTSKKNSTTLGVFCRAKCKLIGKLN